jgi:hypothetical protein
MATNLEGHGNTKREGCGNTKREGTSSLVPQLGEVARGFSR